MGDGVGRGGRFGRRPLGYSRSAVDRFLGEVTAARAGLEAEVARLQSAEPLTRVGDDLAALLRSFAETVSSMRDKAAAHAERVRSEADAYAERVREATDAYADRRKMEIGHLVDQAQERARATATDITDGARREVAAIVREQMTVREALDNAALGIEASREALARLSSRENQDRIDVERSSSGHEPFLPQPGALSMAGNAPLPPANRQA
jgi:cell division septum initiation protein DivIVA